MRAGVVVAAVLLAACGDNAPSTRCGSHPETAPYCPGGWCVEHPFPQPQNLRAVWGACGRDVWAVGDFGALLHWDGEAWGWVASGVSAHLAAVDGTRADDVWAVGDGGTVIHWDGEGWSPVDIGSASDLRAVAAIDRDHVWVAGSSVLARWDGRAWTTDGTQSWTSAWAGSGDDLWLAGQTLSHWDGAAWTTTPLSSTALHVWGDGDDALYAILGSPDPFVSTGELGWFDLAGAWTSTGVDGVNAVAGTGPHDIWAMGWVASHLSRSLPPTVAPFPESSAIAAVFGASETDYHAVGSGGVLARWDGVRWLADPATVPARVVAIDGGRETGLWGLTDAGDLLRLDGSTWEVVQAGRQLSDLSVAGPDDVWVSSWQGLVAHVHSDGVATWFETSPAQPTFPAGAVSSIWAFSATDVWISGDWGDAPYRFDGATWTLVPVPEDPLHAGPLSLWGSGPDDLWGWRTLMAPSGQLLHWDGTAWTLDPTSPPDVLGMSGTSRDDVWAVTPFHAFHRTAAGWTDNLDSLTLNGITSIAPDDVWVSRQDASDPLLHWDGTGWSVWPFPAELGTPSQLHAEPSGRVWVATTANALAVREPGRP